MLWVTHNNENEFNSFRLLVTENHLPTTTSWMVGLNWIAPWIVNTFWLGGWMVVYVVVLYMANNKERDLDFSLHVHKTIAFIRVNTQQKLRKLPFKLGINSPRVAIIIIIIVVHHPSSSSLGINCVIAFYCILASTIPTW